MTRIAIKGIGVVGGFGSGVADLAAALENGQSRIDQITIPSGQGAVQLPAYRASIERLEEFVPKRALRRVDNFSKLGLLGAYLALQDGGMLGADLSRVGIVIASGYGATTSTFAFLDSIIDSGDICASPTHFANSVHNSAAANISIVLGAKGPSLTVSQFEMSVPSALVSAGLWLEEGRVDAVLLGAIDELSDLIGYLWYRQRGLHDGQIAPLQWNRESAIIGEGAAFLLLTRQESELGYCAIDSVETGILTNRQISLPDDALLILGADGRRELGDLYRTTIADSSRIACYAPLYGSSPVGAAFDLACSALILQKGSVYPIPGAACCDMDGAALKLETDQICALRLTETDEYSSIKLSKI